MKAIIKINVDQPLAPRFREIIAIIGSGKGSHGALYYMANKKFPIVCTSNEIEIIDRTLRTGWKRGGGIFSFKEWVDHPIFFDHLDDEKPYALKIYRRKLQEYAGPNIKTDRWLGIAWPPKAQVEGLKESESEPCRFQKQFMANIIQRLASDEKKPAPRDILLALHFAFNTDDINACAYILNHGYIHDSINEPFPYRGKVYQPVLTQAIENESMEGVILALAYGACVRDDDFHMNQNPEIRKILSLHPKDLFEQYVCA